MGVTVESAVTPTVIVAHSLISSASCATALIVIVLYTPYSTRPLTCIAIDHFGLSAVVHTHEKPTTTVNR